MSVHQWERVRSQLTGRLCGTGPGNSDSFHHQGASGGSVVLATCFSMWALPSFPGWFRRAGTLGPLTFWQGLATTQRLWLACAFHASLSFFLCNMRLRIASASRTSHCQEGVLAYSHSPTEPSPGLSLTTSWQFFHEGWWVCLEHRLPTLFNTPELAHGWRCAIEKEPAACPQGFQGDSDMTAQTQAPPHPSCPSSVALYLVLISGGLGSPLTAS